MLPRRALTAIAHIYARYRLGIECVINNKIAEHGGLQSQNYVYIFLCLPKRKA